MISLSGGKGGCGPPEKRGPAGQKHGGGGVGPRCVGGGWRGGRRAGTGGVPKEAGAGGKGNAGKAQQIRGGDVALADQWVVRGDGSDDPFLEQVLKLDGGP